MALKSKPTPVKWSKRRFAGGWLLPAEAIDTGNVARVEYSFCIGALDRSHDESMAPVLVVHCYRSRMSCYHRRCDD